MKNVGRRSVPFYRNARVLPYLWQAAVLIAVILGGILLLLNLRRGMIQQNLNISFDFLGRPAGFRISEGLAFSPTDTYFKAFMVGLFNTFRATIVGIVLASFVGLVAGVSRLSNNWVASRLAFAYVEAMRNVPLLVQLVFWYFAVVLQLPGVRESIRFGEVAYLSKRGLVLPSFQAPTYFWVLALGSLLVAVTIWALAFRLGAVRAPRARWIAAGTMSVGFLVGLLVAWPAIQIDVPKMGTFQVQGGTTLSPEFMALLAALTFYFGGFIAEVIRGGILAVPKGQWEASRALGLGYFTTLLHIVLPQAMIVIVPPLGNIYLNLAKASSLAIAIGYPDLFGLSATIGSQSGYNVQVMVMVLITYMSITFTIAAAINLLNQRIQVRTR